MKIAIITHDQESYIIEMYNKVKLFNYIFILDRCNDNSHKICKSNKINYISNDYGIGFLAGYARQLAVNYFGIDEYILFLDGDKIPYGNLNDLSKYIDKKIDCVLFGVENDRRKYQIDINIYHNKENPHNHVYSCGILLSPYAMKLCQMYSNYNRVWHEIFDGRWGEEDRWIGDVLIYHNCSIMFSKTIILSGIIGGMDGKEDDFAINTINRLRLRKFIGYEF